MATESAVTPDRAHPFTAGEDFCLVHNGSLSNPNGIRRMLEPRGITFETDNDTEAACRFLEWRLREGDDLETALQKGFRGTRRFLHLPHGDARQAGADPRSLRLQACRGGRD
jgi:glutamate synthase domain-containing protein 1